MATDTKIGPTYFEALDELLKEFPFNLQPRHGADAIVISLQCRSYAPQVSVTHRKGADGRTFYIMAFSSGKASGKAPEEHTSLRGVAVRAAAFLTEAFMADMEEPECVGAVTRLRLEAHLSADARDRLFGKAPFVYHFAVDGTTDYIASVRATPSGWPELMLRYKSKLLGRRPLVLEEAGSLELLQFSGPDSSRIDLEFRHFMLPTAAVQFSGSCRKAYRAIFNHLEGVRRMKSQGVTLPVKVDPSRLGGDLGVKSVLFLPKKKQTLVVEFGHVSISIGSTAQLKNLEIPHSFKGFLPVISLKESDLWGK